MTKTACMPRSTTHRYERRHWRWRQRRGICWCRCKGWRRCLSGGRRRRSGRCLVNVGVGVIVGVFESVGVMDSVSVGVGVPRAMTCLPFSVFSLCSNSITDTANPMLSTGRPPEVASILDVLTPITAPSIFTSGHRCFPGLSPRPSGKYQSPIHLWLKR